MPCALNGQMNDQMNDQINDQMAGVPLDVAFALGAVDCTALRASVRCGIWRFACGDKNHPLGTLDGIREVLAGEPVTIVGLLESGRDGVERVLRQSWSCTVALSPARNRENMLRRAGQLPARALRALHRGHLAPQPVAAASAPAAVPPGLPAADGTLRGLAGVTSRIVHRSLQKLTHVEQWFIGYRFAAFGSGPPEQGRFTTLMPPKARFWADPFPIVIGERYFIFFEELPFGVDKGHIAVIEIQRDGRCSAPQVVLERPYHLSYPFLIEHGGALFMVPESGQNRSVELYRCERFPDRWQLERTLLRGVFAVDATLHRTPDRWWMFVTIAGDDQDRHDDLHIYHAPELFGPWQPHAANPVKSDVRSARPAGRLFVRDGRLCRPAQVCVPRYGTALSINEVLELTPDIYREREIERIVAPAGSGVLGIHTLNRAGELCVVDGFVHRSRLVERRIAVFTPRRVASR